MLVVENLTKIYRPKKGKPVTAINNVSLQLPQKGMVFLLGKSGSGKSTLLNLLGGLDSYTSGDILIKGKSTKDFKSSDFDSYRNTYIGFIFQEYNVLEEYTVSKNIALALELQHKKADPDEIKSIMSNVDLETELFDRRIDELSGGQKQRVAIARAIVKNPDIIMADEPTGSLDSLTGKQVFETLKKLSQDRLVIVVSHDRESAELYGDRIIELADGKIVNDMALVAGAFQPTQQFEHTYQADEFQLIKSRLPFVDSLKLAASSLKVKKLRLFFTILLSLIAFTIFGLSATLAAYNQNKSEFATVKVNNEKVLLISSVAGEEGIGGPMYHMNGLRLTPKQIADMERITGNKTLKVLFSGDTSKDYQGWELEKNFLYSNDNAYYANKISYLVEVEKAQDANLISVAEGSRLPNIGNYQEIAISDYIADSLIAHGLQGATAPISSYKDLLNQEIKLNYYNTPTLTLTITGVYKTDIDKEHYARYKETTSINTLDTLVLGSIDSLVLSMGFVSPGFELLPETRVSLSDWEFRLANGIDYIPGYGHADRIGILSETDVYLGGRDLDSLEDDEIIVRADYLSNSSYIEEIKTTFDALTTIQKRVNFMFNNKFVGKYRIAGLFLNKEYYEQMFVSDIALEQIKEVNNQQLKILDSESHGIAHPTEYWGIALNKFINAEGYDLSSLDVYWGKGNSPKTNLKDNEIIIDAKVLFSNSSSSSTNHSRTKIKDAFDKADKELLFGKLISCYQKGEFKHHIIDGIPIKIVGVFLEGRKTATSIASNQLLKDIEEVTNYPKTIIVKLSNDWNKNKELFKYLENSEQNENLAYTKLVAHTSASVMLDDLSTMATVLKKIFLYVALVLSVFAGLLLMNFIGVSIANKTKQIGVLRAIGARRWDILLIFLIEAIIIALCNFMLSFIAVSVISMIINSKITISALVPGVLQAIFMLLLSLGVAMLATIIPVYKITKKKPIDAIYNR